MDRREAFRLAAVASAGAGLMGPRAVRAEARAAQAKRGLPSPKIKDVQVIATAPAGLRLIVVKVLTDQDGLYGYGCATFTQRADLVTRGREVPEAAPDRPSRRSHRRHWQCTTPPTGATVRC